MPINFADYAAFGTLVESIYATVSNREKWHGALAAMRTAFDADIAVAIIAPDSDNRHGLSAVLADDYCEIPDINKTVPADCPFASIAPHSIATVLDLLSEEEWQASNFYKTIGGARNITDVLCMEVRLEDGSIYRLRFMRCDRTERFGQNERDIAKLILPHLSQAFRMARENACQAMIHRRYVEVCDRLGVGAFVLDGKGRVLEQNSAASLLLAHGDAIALRAGRLMAHNMIDDRTLQLALRTVLQNDGTESTTKVLSLGRDDAASLGITVQRIADAEALRAGASRPTAVVFVRDPEFQLENCTRTAQVLFDLTQSESALVMQLVNGLSLPEAADAMRIRHTTARTHLRSIFAKTGITRQSSLVRQVLNSVAILTGDGSEDVKALRPH